MIYWLLLSGEEIQTHLLAHTQTLKQLVHLILHLFTLSANEGSEERAKKVKLAYAEFKHPPVKPLAPDQAPARINGRQLVVHLKNGPSKRKHLTEWTSVFRP